MVRMVSENLLRGIDIKVASRIKTVKINKKINSEDNKGRKLHWGLWHELMLGQTVKTLVWQGKKLK